jgi:hypothetical protein
MAFRTPLKGAVAVAEPVDLKLNQEALGAGCSILFQSSTGMDWMFASTTRLIFVSRLTGLIVLSPCSKIGLPASAYFRRNWQCTGARC